MQVLYFTPEYMTGPLASGQFRGRCGVIAVHRVTCSTSERAFSVDSAIFCVWNYAKYMSRDICVLKGAGQALRQATRSYGRNGEILSCLEALESKCDGFDSATIGLLKRNLI